MKKLLLFVKREVHETNKEREIVMLLENLETHAIFLLLTMNTRNLHG